MSVAPVRPSGFEQAVAAVRAVRLRPEISIDETPAPQRIAPHSLALSAEVTDSDDDIATARFVLLHDPDGVEAWAGTYRVVVFIRADLEPDLATDPLLTQVAWSWLTEALDAVAVAALAGTVTRVASESFGSLEEQGVSGQVEIRASWTPQGPPSELGLHVEAWARAMATAAGLVPVPAGVSVLAPTSRSR